MAETDLRRPGMSAADLLPGIIRSCRSAISHEFKCLPCGGIYNSHVVYAVFIALGAEGLCRRLHRGQAAYILRKWADRIEAGSANAEDFIQP